MLGREGEWNARKDTRLVRRHTSSSIPDSAQLPPFRSPGTQKGEVLGEVSTLVVPSQKIDALWIAHLQAVKIEETLRQR